MSLAILQRQIADEIESKTCIDIVFSDKYEETLSLYDQREFHNGEYDETAIFIKPVFCDSKRIPENLYNELINNTKNGELQYNPDYNKFYDKYYNNLDPVAKAA